MADSIWMIFAKLFVGMMQMICRWIDIEIPQLFCVFSYFKFHMIFLIIVKYSKFGFIQKVIADSLWMIVLQPLVGMVQMICHWKDI
jgi:hypothetical protein